MGNSTFAGSLPLQEPKIQQLFNIVTRAVKVDTNCAKIGTIQDIDFTTMTASVQVVFQQQMRNGSYQTVPLLTDVPVITPQGGGYSLQFPIEKGDTCLLIFADRNIDNWFQSGGVQPPADGRLHAISDAIALVGLNGLASPLGAAPSSTEARIVDKAGTTKVGLSGGKITVANSSGTLLAALQTLVEGIQGATAGGNPLSDATGKIAQALTALQALLY
jgi:Phage protein Gp138 N-terminal domain